MTYFKADKILQAKDSRVDAVLKSLREDEMYQAIHRLRPAIHPGKCAFIYSAVPIPGIAPEAVAGPGPQAMPMCGAGRRIETHGLSERPHLCPQALDRLPTAVEQFTDRNPHPENEKEIASRNAASQRRAWVIARRVHSTEPPDKR